MLAVAIRHERDVVLARTRARQIATLLGFEAQDQTRIATAVSEIARNAFQYARAGRVEFALQGTTAPQVLVIRVTDAGPGIADLDAVLEGRYVSSTGSGLGIVGASRLVDQFGITSTPGQGTTVELKRLLSRRAGVIGSGGVARITEELARREPSDAFEEVQLQNQELVRALDELGRRQEEMAALNRELEDTNRGVVALYAELDEKADHLRRADELKSRFLSNMSHEFRTPVHSIQALARMLLEQTDGPLTSEQDRQVSFIRKAADALAELVNDLLDLAKVEAGKTVVRAVDFDVDHLFGALRGMLRPLLVNDSVALVFEDAPELPALRTDEAKVSQILRNFVSNALKFTERGEIRVSARVLPEESAIAFSVADTGIGIAPEDQERIFLEFTQIDSPIQRKVHGTGLGLPLCRRLAELLGGRVGVESTPGVGSTFVAVVPMVYRAAMPQAPAWDLDPQRIPILVVEDSRETALVYEKMVAASEFQLLTAHSVRETHDALAAFRPRAIILDIALEGEDAWGLLTDLKRRGDGREIPVAVVTTVDDEGKALALGADLFVSKPVDRQRLLGVLTRLVAPETVRRVLVVDDEEISRYVLRQHLVSPRRVVLEASSGTEAIRLAQRERPDVICLDLGMPDVDGGDVLRALKADTTTRDIPIVVVTARVLDEAERRALDALGVGVLPKSAMSREDALAAVDAALGETGGPL
jgi:signal transduction histidine kinase/CheY-like chemotaxis protein